MEFVRSLRSVAYFFALDREAEPKVKSMKKTIKKTLKYSSHEV